jgi:hypothetical protein
LGNRFHQDSRLNFGGCQTSGLLDGTRSCLPNSGTGNSLGASGSK